MLPDDTQLIPNHYRGIRRNTPIADWARRHRGRIFLTSAAVLLIGLAGIPAWAAVVGDRPLNCRGDIDSVNGGTLTCAPMGAAPTTTAPTSSPTPTPTPTPAPNTVTITQTVTASATTSTPPAPSATTTRPPTTSERVIQAYVTGYTFFDNTPPGTANIAMPRKDGTGKAQGDGSYANPTSVAVGHVITNGRSTPDWPKGTIIYIPNLQRYFLVDDLCGDGDRPQDGPCHTDYPSNATTWFDVWLNGKGGNDDAADRCARAITNVTTVVIVRLGETGPTNGELGSDGKKRPVTTGDIYQASGCTQQYGNAL